MKAMLGGKVISLDEYVRGKNCVLWVTTLCLSSTAGDADSREATHACIYTGNIWELVDSLQISL